MRKLLCLLALLACGCVQSSDNGSVSVMINYVPWHLAAVGVQAKPEDSPTSQLESLIRLLEAMRQEQPEQPEIPDGE